MYISIRKFPPPPRKCKNIKPLNKMKQLVCKEIVLTIAIDD